MKFDLVHLNWTVLDGFKGNKIVLVVLNYFSNKFFKFQ